ncbi:hypothetical protein HGG71_11560 [Rhodobacteraceae bacterium R_SAG2]|nr:hypothetical protein [Rhodobacteraceae bacterium R_SAG2]
MEATDTPLSDEQAIDMLTAPIETEDEVEADEAPQEETEAEETETEDDASEVEDEKDDEAEEDADDSEDEESDEEADADDDEDEASDDERPDQLYTVKVDGEEKQVSLSELQRGYSGQAYIQKGMEANKAQARQLEEQAQTLQQQAQVALQLYEQAQQTGFTPAPQKPDPALVQTDPIAYMEQTAAYQTQLEKYQQEQQQVAYLRQQQEQQTEQQRRQHIEEQERLLLEEMPELREPEKAEAFKKTLLSASEQYGFTKEELRQIVTDRRSVKALADAQKWRELQASKAKAKKPREASKPVTKPRGKMRDGSKVKFQKGLQKAVKTQDPADFVGLLLNPDN